MLFPKRIRLRWSLRTLLALQIACCPWLAWESWRHAREAQAEREIQAIFPHANCRRESGNWLASLPEDWRPSIFESIVAVDLSYDTTWLEKSQPKQHHVSYHFCMMSPLDAARREDFKAALDRKLKSFPLDQLPALRVLALDDSYVSEPAIQHLLAIRPDLLIDESLLRNARRYTSLIGVFSRYPVDAVKRDASGRTRRKMLQNLGRLLAKPQPCCDQFDGRRRGGRFPCRAPELRRWLDELPDEPAEAAALTLWRCRSFANAEAVVDFVRRHAPISNYGRRLHGEVNAALQPASIVAEIERGDAEWGAWLAGMVRPPAAIEPLVRVASLSASTAPPGEVLLALAQYDDPRATKPLSDIVRWEPFSRRLDIAAGAMATRNRPALEQVLLDRLDAAEPADVPPLCGMISQFGSSKSIPLLRKIADARQMGEPAQDAADHTIREILRPMIDAAVSRMYAGRGQAISEILPRPATNADSDVLDQLLSPK